LIVFQKKGFVTKNTKKPPLCFHTHVRIRAHAPVRV